MNLLMKRLTLILFFITASTHAANVEVGEDGMYWLKYDSSRLSNVMYQVDKKAQLCMAIYISSGTGGITEVPCSSLAKRDEWKEIIDWVQ